eukprot:ctg_138.g99
MIPFRSIANSYHLFCKICGKASFLERVFLSRFSTSRKFQREEGFFEEPKPEKEKKQPTLETVEESAEIDQTVEMWNPNAPSGPEWGGPSGYEPTFGDWSKNCRVSDF